MNDMDNSQIQPFVYRIQEEFRMSSRFGLGTALDMYPIMTCDSNEAPNVYQAKVNYYFITVLIRFI